LALIQIFEINYKIQRISVEILFNLKGKNYKGKFYLLNKLKEFSFLNAVITYWPN